MIRNILGSLLALVGAAAAVWSPFRAWYGGRHGSDIRVDDLFTGVGATSAGAALLGSLFLPMLFAALLTVLGILLRSWPVVALAGVLVLGVTVLWMVRQGQAAGSLTAGGDGLDVGVAAAFGGGALLLVGAAVMSGRPRRTIRYGEPAPGFTPSAYDPAPYDPAPHDPPPYDPAPHDPPLYDPAPHDPPLYDPAPTAYGAEATAPYDAVSPPYDADTTPPYGTPVHDPAPAPVHRPDEDEDEDTETLPPLPGDTVTLPQLPSDQPKRLI